MNLTLASGLLTFFNNVLTFTPPDTLGGPGETVTNFLSVSDTLGNALSNTVWTFDIVRPVVATDTFLSLKARFLFHYFCTLLRYKQL